MSSRQRYTRGLGQVAGPGPGQRATSGPRGRLANRVAFVWMGYKAVACPSHARLGLEPQHELADKRQHRDDHRTGKHSTGPQAQRAGVRDDPACSISPVRRLPHEIETLGDRGTWIGWNTWRIMGGLMVSSADRCPVAPTFINDCSQAGHAETHSEEPLAVEKPFSEGPSEVACDGFVWFMTCIVPQHKLNLREGSSRDRRSPETASLQRQ